MLAQVAREHLAGLDIDTLLGVYTQVEDRSMLEFVLLFLAFYIWHGLGVTIGYHRLLSHRSFSCPKAVEYFWIFAGYLSFEGSPIWWATIHRAHHRYVDTPLDPHSPKYGLRNAHMGWFTHTSYSGQINPLTQCKDLLKDPIYRFLEQNGAWRRAHVLAFLLNWGFRGVILIYFGWIPALASILAGYAVLQIPLMLNVICHLPKLGYKNYRTNDDSVNVWWVALLALGEGWHNNHHICPGSAKTGIRFWEFDFSWLVIVLMKHLNMATRVNVYVPAKLSRKAYATARTMVVDRRNMKHLARRNHDSLPKTTFSSMSNT